MMNLYVQYCKLAAWIAFRHCFLFLRWISWQISGVASTVNKSRTDSTFYHKSAHVQQIFLKYCIDPIDYPFTSHDFLTTHGSFEDPEYVLQNHVTVLGMNSREIWFVETDPHVDVGSSNIASFMRVAQYKFAKKLIVLPLHCAHALTDKLPDLGKNTIFVSNIGRCGGTLLVQVFEETGRYISWCEPRILYDIAHPDEGTTEEHVDRNTMIAIKMLCKPVRPHVQGYIVKFVPHVVGIIPRLHRLFPQAKLLFVYRDILPTIMSTNKLFDLSPYLGLKSRVFMCRKKQTLASFNIHNANFVVNVNCRSHFSAIFIASLIHQYSSFKHQGLPVVAVKYEDVVSHTLDAFRQLFRFLELHFDAVVQDAVTRAFSRDSQRGSEISRKNMDAIPVDQLNPDQLRTLNEILAHYGLPEAGETYEAPDTITRTQARIKD